VKLTFSLLLVAFFIYLLYRFSDVLPPMVLAIILAYVLSPAVKLLQERLHLRRGLAVLLAYVLMLAVLITLPIVIVPPLAAQLTGLNLDIQRFLLAIENLLGHRYIVAGQVIDLDEVIQQAVGSLQGVVEPVFGQTLTLAVEVISSVVWVIFILVVSFYLIKDGRRYTPGLRGWCRRLTAPTTSGCEMRSAPFGRHSSVVSSSLRWLWR
jgi:predicted PurR-regulated permease PerM